MCRGGAINRMPDYQRVETKIFSFWSSQNRDQIEEIFNLRKVKIMVNL